MFDPIPILNIRSRVEPPDSSRTFVEVSGGRLRPDLHRSGSAERFPEADTMYVGAPLEVRRTKNLAFAGKGHAVVVGKV